ncbi:MAG: DUF3435 domain-containing protein [Verrucomicrobiae bacterium]|nr:DUF3435 domain-containing protein [Verrucomicrobiae bacterium]MCX7723422.1 DUF3435 domain-containing protein [Verrucomicrobiae bacterium]
MKTAYELVMERLSKTAPAIKLTDEQKRQLAELDSVYSAKIAELEITLKDQIAKAVGAGDYLKAQELEQQLVNERKKLQAELEAKKEAVRQGKKQAQ